MDSREFQQRINFYGYPITVEVRSAHDPHVLFGARTRGRFVLDESPGGQIAAGIILLLFAIAMLGMSAFKSYRFCIKYTCRDYLRRRRMKKYLASAREDSDETEFRRNYRGDQA